MPVPLTFELRDGIGKFTTVGDVEFDEGLKVLNMGLQEVVEFSDKSRLILFDLLKSTEDRSANEILEIANAVKEKLEFGKLVMVASAPLIYGLSRMFAAHTDVDGFDTFVTKTMDEALLQLKLSIKTEQLS